MYMKVLGTALCIGLLLAGPWSITTAQARKSVAEDILDILQASGQISDQQYKDLLNKARAEEEQSQAVSDLRDTVSHLEENVNDRPKNYLMPYWKGGLRLDSLDGNFKLKIGGRILSDWALFDTDRDVNGGRAIGDGTEFRQARIMISGLVYNNMKYKSQLDFEGTDTDFKDVYIEITKIPYFGNLRVGHYKEPFSLEQANSRTHFTFMERGLPNTFSPERNTGFMLHNTAFDKRALWGVGVFRDADDSGNSFGPDSNYNITARFSGVPWYEEKGRKLLHLGLSYSHQFRDGRGIRYRARPEAHLSPRFVDTDTFAAEGVNIFNPELGFQYGPASMQFEWISAFVNRPEQTDAHFHGFYVLGTYFLTGEHRSYRPTVGSFDKITPLRNLDWNGGWGAWQLAGRYSTLDLSDNNIQGGELGNLTFGINWYLNPNMRVAFNYIHADLKDSGAANILQSRFMVFY